MSTPRVSAGGFLFKDGMVLLGFRSASRAVHPSVWDAIGGHLEAGESPADALIRELQEEIQVSPLEVVELTELSEPRPDLYGESIHYLFLVTRWEGGPVATGPEHAEIRWFTVAEAVTLPLAHPAYAELLRRLGRITGSPGELR